MPIRSERTLESIADRAAAEIVAAIRARIVEEVQKAIDERVAAVIGRDRVPRGAPANQAPVPFSAPAPAGRAPHPRRSYTQGDLDAVLEEVRRSPGLRAEEYLEHVNMDRKAFFKVIAKLRDLDALRAEGRRRGTRYRPA